LALLLWRQYTGCDLAGFGDRWEKSKFFKLWQMEKKAGRDPHKAFKVRGWEP